ncbi:hypothetical protein C3B58_07730 [Lactonifactor longoviformis]|uniref:Uncharacterized protein n=1 Tax=Lactonifactor longoviformis DSM 17459 TaxID=1122155 RepID=A0A1M5DCC9_9CLOT|nr:hypothetical protein [Lactonifactor longoviformis]POP33381.1 hypothetical protein C3B58_07730 [Lactonifactor longoviformis]SHF64575.1 hypothetical protein SAMN02745158_04496 [Lactonifactor longoviformis DSM 17459]
MKILLSTFLTIVSGSLVFIVGQIVVECYVKPMQEYKSIKSEISYILVYYANVFMNPVNKAEDNFFTDTWQTLYDEASKELRIAASKLAGFKQRKPFFVKKDKVEMAQSALIGLSNGLFTSDVFRQVERNEKMRREICEGLNLK